MSGSGLLNNLTVTKRAALVREQGEELLDEDEKGAHSVSTPGGDQPVGVVATALATVGSALLVESRALRDEVSL